MWEEFHTDAPHSDIPDADSEHTPPWTTHYEADPRSDTCRETHNLHHMLHFETPDCVCTSTVEVV